MQGWLKIGVGVVVGLVAVVVIAIAGLLLFFDPNDYYEYIVFHYEAINSVRAAGAGNSGVRPFATGEGARLAGQHVADG